MSRVVKLARAAVLALSLLVIAGRAHAHPESLPTLVNRYISLVVVDQRADLTVTLLHGDLPGAERRRAMDADGNGTIDERELEGERGAWARRAGELVRLSVDGQPLVLAATASIDLAGEPAVSARPLVVEVATRLPPLAPGRHTFTVEPGPDRPRDGETEVTIDLGARDRLVASRRGRGEPTEPPQSRFLFAGPRASVIEDRSVSFVVEAGGGGSGGGSSGPAVAAALAGLAAIGAGGIAFLVRRIRRRR